MTRDDTDDGRHEATTAERTDTNGTTGSSGMSRRESLKLGGAALAATTGLGAFSKGADAQSSYTTRTLDAGETVTIDLADEPNNTYENVLVDASADGAEFSIQAIGSNWTVRNVGILGPLPSGVNHVIRMNVTDPGGVGTVENVYIEDVTNNFMFCQAQHEGHIDITNSTFINNSRDEEDTLYGSPPGNPDADWGKDTGQGGTIHVEGCYCERIAGYGWRMGSDGSVVENCTLVDMERVALANLYGRTVYFRDVDVVNASLGLRLGDHVNGDDTPGLTKAPRTVVENVRIDAATDVSFNDHNGNEPELVGSIEGNPDPTPPAGAPMSAEEAASGSSGGGGGGSTTGPDDRIVFSGSGTQNYSFATSGSVDPAASIESSDDAGDSSASGIVGNDYTDEWTFDGDLTDLSMDLGDGRITATLDRSAGEVTLQAGSNTDYIRYTIAVTGDIEGVSGIDGGDNINDAGDSVSGGLADGATETYSYTGELLTVDLDEGGATVDVTHHHVLSIEDVSDGATASYDLSVTGTLEKSDAMGATIDDNDTISGGSASGRVNGGTDSYQFSGELTAFSVDNAVRTYVDGEEVVTGSLGGNVADVTGTADAQEYGFTVVGGAGAYDGIAGSDTVAGRDVSGTVWDGSTDSYDYRVGVFVAGFDDGGTEVSYRRV
ncbi:hypothetical protein [Halomarina oriensis]|uniref:Right handed beta helix domain-containing protein n=1 Tax=Halomarina oriensis TaxID=671145 RepID=A0A6B0GH05_9EURY|nr:hypothetical protein [Halomarina oriensis]MWG33850.1 hypothetical protein [Halomarina oriensis]